METQHFGPEPSGRRPERITESVTFRTHKTFAGEEQRAKGLGWFSVGLGLAEFVTPGTISQVIGVKENKILMRLFGLREITSGLGIFSRRRPTGWVWSRVIGDFIDLALLGTALMSRKANKKRVAFATAAVAGVTVLDIITSRQLATATAGHTFSDSVYVTKSITINKPADQLYRFWRDFTNHPLFMKNIQSVEVTGQNRSHWIAKGPAETRIEWDSIMLTDTPNEQIAWRTVENSDIEHAGAVQFLPAPAGRGTKVLLEILYRPPGGQLGAAIGKLFGKIPGQQAQEDLRRFKQLMETGEMATTEGQPSGPRSTVGRMLKNKV